MLASPSQTPESTTAQPTVPIAESSQKITRGHSCVLCQQRKVKCDRQKPCANCVKARAECVVATPSQPRRRRKRLTESDLVMRLRRYEHLLKSHGVKIETEDLHPQDHPRPSREHDDIGMNDFRRLTLNVPTVTSHEPGALFFSKNHAQFTENTLWETMKEEIEDQVLPSSEDDFDESDVLPPGEAVLMSFNSGHSDLLSYHPSVVDLFRLWQIFLDNVNPLVKIFHAPTVQQMMIASSGSLDTLSRPNEALLFSIYFLSILSLSEEECFEQFGENRQKLLVKYMKGVQQALVNARLLKTMNLTTLQAFILYLIGGRRLFDAHTIWALSGVAVRIAQRLGIHTDAGTAKLPPFDAEMRRRTWWQLVFLDGHSSKLAGAPFPAWLSKFDAKLPINISDSEISPSMTELPASKEGITEMIFCAVRYECLQVLRSALTFTAMNEDGSLRDPTIAELMDSKDKAIAELEQLFDRKFIRYCDPSIPLQLLIMYMTKSVVATLKIMAHHPRNYENKGVPMPQAEKDMVFLACLQELEINSYGHENQSLRRFMWHIHVYFQLDAFINIVSELRVRTTGELADRAWEQVKLAYEHRQEMLMNNKNPLFLAIGSLVLKAWAKREEAHNGAIAQPNFITRLRDLRSATRSKSTTESPQQDQTCDQPPLSKTGFPYQISTAPMAVGIPDQMNLWDHTYGTTTLGSNFEPPVPGVTAMEWEYWQTLMDGELPTYSPTPNAQGWM